MPTALLPFETLIFALGLIAALILLAALIAGISRAQHRIWPCPPAGSARSIIYWTCFRTLNMAVVALSLMAIASDVAAGGFNGVRLLIAAFSAAVFAVYIRSLWALGRDATYCNASGLNTAGIYRWSRNPQYATAMAGYSLMALAAFDAGVVLLALALIAVYALMALSEEPWLDAKYGAAYRGYCAVVPRFFNLRRALRRMSRSELTTPDRAPNANPRP